MVHKKKLRYIDQLALFKLRGVSGIDLNWSMDNISHNNSELERQLRTISTLGYYQLKGYAAPYMNNGKYVNVSFGDIVKRYYLDKKLRQATLNAIEDIEATLNTRIAYLLGKKYNATGYLKFNNWCQLNSKNTFIKSKNNGYVFMDKAFVTDAESKFKNRLKNKVKKSSNLDVIDYLKNNESTDVPIWLVMNELTLGESIYLYKLMNKKNKEYLASLFGCSVDEFVSYLECINLVRNICCHNGNLADINLITKPKIPKKFTKVIAYQKQSNLKIMYSNKLVVVVCIIRYLMDNVNPRYDFGYLEKSIKKLVTQQTPLTYYGFNNNNSLKILFNKKRNMRSTQCTNEAKLDLY